MTQTDEITYKKVEHDLDSELKQAAYLVRYNVFCKGQGVDPNYERDAIDDTCMHFVAMINSKVVGTLRAFKVDKGIQLSRIAVLESCRGKGIGKGLIKFTESKFNKGDKIVMEAQDDKKGFYQSLGYKLESEEVYYKQNIAHVKMIKSI